MKKILAVFLLSLLVFSLSSCFTNGTDSMQDDIPSCRQDENGVYYTALDIGVKSYLYENENGEVYTQFELLVGLRSVVGDAFLLDSAAERKLGELINRKTGKNFKYIDVESVGENFERYRYVVEDRHNILNETDRKFGFFFIRRNFTLDNPVWVNCIKNSIHGAVTELFNGFTDKNVKIDNDAIRLRYYFAAANGFYADNAVEVYDPQYQIGYFMWKESDFSHLPIYYKSMASGWYILPILLGVIVVLILTFKLKGRKNESVFLTEQPDNADKNDVLEGQVTIEDVLNSKEAENDNG